MAELSADPAARMLRALTSLEGLSVGDAFGENFFTEEGSGHIGSPAPPGNVIEKRIVPGGNWMYTDDTEMALAIVEVLAAKHTIDQEMLSYCYARNYYKYGLRARRSYGMAAHQILTGIVKGYKWKELSKSAFGGQGSLGNGAAMRVAPLGSYFADDISLVVSQAQLSAEITHWNPDAQAGAIAVAVAAAWAVRESSGCPTGVSMFDFVLQHTPDSPTKKGIEQAREIPKDTPIAKVAELIGSGYKVMSVDSVPFVIWNAAHHSGSYTDALWSTVAGLGDRDTTCAMVGGIVVHTSGRKSVPQEWLAKREPFIVGDWESIPPYCMQHWTERGLQTYTMQPKKM